MQHRNRPWRAALVESLALGAMVCLTGIGLAGTPHGAHGAGSTPQSG